MANLISKRKIERAWKTLQRGWGEPALLRTVLREAKRRRLFVMQGEYYANELPAEPERLE